MIKFPQNKAISFTIDINSGSQHCNRGHLSDSFIVTGLSEALSWFQFSRSVVSDSLQPHEPQHTRPPGPPPTPGACSPSSQWCHPTISSSVIPFSSCPQSFPAPGPFQMSQQSASGGQSIGVSATTSVLPVNIQDFI